ncbi:PP2C family protein-serine/threonine phosphatase [Caminicella sporogenes]|uniref:PP2C family protein-serine/threonine phosphatase n=1 Tax=Caminicella sporogenes TaxID=166485 RepID=UPI00253F8428|nr:SpoIIE family protein phosphatase [Caminicella sporogenes]WIF95809.1 SpoIIE family protein phosphatase [Caminicella sporogenes]
MIYLDSENLLRENKKLKEKLKIVLEQNKRFKNDLKYAQKIQEYILPIGKHEFNQYEIYCNHVHTNYLGGDFYDVFKFDDRKIVMYIADVSGHGVASSLFTLFLKQSIRGISNSFHLNRQPITPSEILRKLQCRFNDFNTDKELYIGVLVGVLDIYDNEIILANAGHNVEPLHFKKKENEVISYDIRGFPINNWFDDSTFFTLYDEKKIYLNEEDRLIFLTDGATEAKSIDGKILGIKKIGELMKQKESGMCEEYFESLINMIINHIGKNELEDDIALLCLRRKKD